MRESHFKCQFLCSLSIIHAVKVWKRQARGESNVLILFLNKFKGSRSISIGRRFIKLTA